VPEERHAGAVERPRELGRRVVAARDAHLKALGLQARENVLREPLEPLERDHALEVPDEQHGRTLGEPGVAQRTPVRSGDVGHRRV
jgi:hypothetical protein